MVCTVKEISIVKGKRGDNNDNNNKTTNTGTRDDDSSSKKGYKTAGHDQGITHNEQ